MPLVQWAGRHDIGVAGKTDYGAAITASRPQVVYIVVA